ncbi:hypothetical protein [Myxococcus virescens]|uniref:Uncharacterized protein n=1 Tax=Myxococcus virescens TaxID=83456 RepID=A0A511HPW3_9BACT|nr:hypothetical protein [Myxococcus virescens]GEL75637.1 hypothetical protein MVI01_74210 [Myxococcus virescens]SDF27495.1 hypothetical protein SAMN04488504_12747 [Myxococcus virescens]
MIIGTDTTYLGNEIPGLQGQKVRIFAVLHGGTRPDADPDADDYYADTDEKLARLGGVTAEDRIDAAPIRPDGTTSFVHVDPRAIDLECFAHLRNPSAQ